MNTYPTDHGVHSIPATTGICGIRYLPMVLRPAPYGITITDLLTALLDIWKLLGSLFWRCLYRNWVNARAHLTYISMVSGDGAIPIACANFLDPVIPATHDRPSCTLSTSISSLVYGLPPASSTSNIHCAPLGLSEPCTRIHVSIVICGDDDITS